MRGLFGGTFNPIHEGHLSAAREVASKLGLERVIFIPNANPPHKEVGAEPGPGEQLAPAETRLAWVEACVADEPLFEVSRCEIDREGPSYLIDTLHELTGGRAEAFVFIVGQDAFREMGQWRAPKELFAACSWAVCTRPPLLEGRLDHWLPEIVRDDFEVSEDGREARHRLAPTRIELIEIEPVDISASELRTALAAGRTDIARWLPAAARDAILSSGCYTRGAVSHEMPPPSQETPPMSELDRVAKARLLAEAALELKAEDPVVLDMREVSSFADTFVILSGRSDRHVRSVAEAVIDAIKQAGEDLLGSEGLDDGQWVLIDSNDVVIHVFDPEAREHFDLERLWADAPRLDLVEDLGLDLELAEPA